MFLPEIDRLLYEMPLDPKAICSVYHEMLLDNAAHATTPPRTRQYAEEFLANTLYLLELGQEQDARFQLETAQFLLRQEDAGSIPTRKTTG